MVNAQIRQFRKQIIATTNASELPIEVKRLVFFEVLQMINSESDKIISVELEQREVENNTGE